jgi:hypothetical protein
MSYNNKPQTVYKQPEDENSLTARQSEFGQPILQAMMSSKSKTPQSGFG